MAVPNRRSLIAGTSAAVLVGISSSRAKASDAAEDACLRFVALQDQSTTLSDEEPVLESWLCQKYTNFLDIPDDEQDRYPEAARFKQIRQEAEALDVEIAKLLPVVLKSKCRTPAAIVAKLMAAERLTCGDEHPQLKKLLISTTKDLGELFAVRTWKWATPWPNSNGPGTSTYEPT